MKQGFHKLLSLAMALLVLLTSASFAVDMHYCGDTLVDFSLVNDSKTCGMESKTAAEPLKSSACNAQLNKKSCCSNKHFEVESQDHFKNTPDQLHFTPEFFIAGFVYSYLSLFSDNSEDYTAFERYRPPHINYDVQLLHQTFII